jgi:general secretion pathway protein K
MKFSLRNNERGMVLLIVLLVVALLVTILVEFAFSTLVDLRLAETYRDSTRATYLAKGGIRVGRIILQEDSNGYDSLNETWAQSLENYPVAEGDVSIRIDDQGGRLDLNRVVTPQGNIDPLFKDRIIRLFELLDGNDPTAQTDALIDWIDPDDDSQPAGGENFYYRSLQQPYNCKNAPLDNLEELNLIKGFDREFTKKLSQHVTVYGLAKVNVNTASLEVLQTIAAEMDRSTAETIIDARRSQPFTSIPQLKELPGLETLYGFIYLYLDVKSSRYQIESTSFVNDGRRTIHVAVAKDGDRILYKRVL